MPETQGKGQGEGSVEKSTSRAGEQGGTGGGGKSTSSQKAADNVQKVREQTRSDIGKTLGR